MTREIRPVNASNWRAIIALKPKAHQEAFIEPNAVSILESFYDRSLKWSCYGLYEDGEPVGFMMAGAGSLYERYIWLDRFMLDGAYQGNGRGKAFLALIIRFLSAKCYVKTIKTSMKADNEPVKHLYASAGFVSTGTVDPEFDEEVWVYHVT